MIHYKGVHCGICGKWVKEPFEIPEYQSYGKWWDTWGLCEECIKITRFLNKDYWRGFWFTPYSIGRGLRRKTKYWLKRCQDENDKF